MRNAGFSVILLIVFTMCGYSQSVYTLTEILELASAQSPAGRINETRKENRYWQYRVYRSNYNPQLVLNGNLPDYNRDFFQNRLDDGTIRYQERQQTTGTLNLGLVQPVILSGGTLSVNTNLSRYNDHLFDINQWNSTLINIRFNQPVFAFNSLKWDRRTEPLRYEESKREYAEELEYIAQQTTERFFSVLEAQINLDIAKLNLQNNDTVHTIEQQRYALGTTTNEKLLQAELQLLRAKQEMNTALLSLQNTKLDLLAYLGLKQSDEFTLQLPEVIPRFTIDPATALNYARNNRAAYIAFERRRIEAEQEKAKAKGERFQINIQAVYGLNSIGDRFGEVYTNPLSQQQLTIGFSIPLVDWGRNQARMRVAEVNSRLNDYLVEQDEINFEREIITQVNQLGVLINQLETSRQLDRVAMERYQVSRDRYLAGKIDITNLAIALSEKDQARRSYIAALRAFWILYYTLRRLTLYDFATNKLLYKPE
ncbi:MAG: TolC family protein [Cyclobacteriaceae bacterium]